MNANQRINALFEMPINPITADHILQECRRIEQDNPYIPSGYKWVLDYKRFQVEIGRGNLASAAKHLKAAIGLVPYDDGMLGTYKQLFRKNAPSEYIALIISCKKYEGKALQLAEQFDAAMIEYAIISGSDSEPINHPRAAQVDAPDNYEGLPKKVVAAYTWVYENVGTNVGVLKVDDDQTLFDEKKFLHTVTQMNQINAYAGVPVSGVTHDRCWHWNKCQDPALNKRSYGRPFLRAWAMGGAYFLGPAQLEKLVLAMIRFPGLFEGEYYEDKLVGDVLALENVELTTLKAYEEFGLTLTEGHRFNET